MLDIKWICKSYSHKKEGWECKLLKIFGVKKGKSWNYIPIGWKKKTPKKKEIDFFKGEERRIQREVKQLLLYPY